MLVLGIPDIVVREAVHVDIEPAIRVGIHVHHEASCDRSSVTPPVQSGQVEFYAGPLKSTNLPHQLKVILFNRHRFPLLQDLSGKNLRNYIHTIMALKPWPRREHILQL